MLRSHSFFALGLQLVTPLGLVIHWVCSARPSHIWAMRRSGKAWVSDLNHEPWVSEPWETERNLSETYSDVCISKLIENVFLAKGSNTSRVGLHLRNLPLVGHLERSNFTLRGARGGISPWESNVERSVWNKTLLRESQLLVDVVLFELVPVAKTISTLFVQPL